MSRPDPYDSDLDPIRDRLASSLPVQQPDLRLRPHDQELTEKLLKVAILKSLKHYFLYFRVMQQQEKNAMLNT